jgi:uncharacterized damage-inducible protein DinB
LAFRVGIVFELASRLVVCAIGFMDVRHRHCLELLAHLERSMNHFTSLFRFKSWANAELLEALEAIDAASHPSEHKAALRTVNHLHVVDQIFRGHLQSVPHGFEATNTPHTPMLAELRQSVGAIDDWYVHYVDGLDDAQLTEEVRFSFTDGDAGRMTRQEILMHVLTHGGYHRGAVGQVLRGVGIAPPRELYTRFLHATEPQRRAHV